MTERPVRPTIAQIREISQPISVTGRSTSEHWVADLYLRRLSPYLTRIFLRTPISANGVTWLMILTGASIGPALLIQGWVGIALALFLSQLQMLIDCCDGEVARWRNTKSPMGIFLDKLGHYLAECLIPLCLGLRLAGWPTESVTTSIYPYFGALLAILVLINKGLNDAVHVARAFSGLEKIQDTKGVNLPVKGLLRSLRKVFNYLPAHRIFHSVEFTILIVIFGSFSQALTIALGIAIFVTLGHITAIVTSSKLRNM
jgi:phosphatidylglycerophosphate synthase|uniref:CDP-alcohol phosphatidyltransferase family protein n=1 Tax=Candidatus Planktophila sp. TaxID=2175601 RepID=UPI00404A36DA